jgi:glucuronokinase
LTAWLPPGTRTNSEGWRERMSLVTEAFARAGLLGNPSDGYFGKIIAVTIKNFAARVFIRESPELRIEASAQDADVFKNSLEFLESVNLYGYYGGQRLVKAAVKGFFDFCRSHGISHSSRNFTMRYESTIPRQVGLGGSSAIIVAAMRGLMAFYRVQIPLHILPTLVLNAELKELGINAGFMDRVVQVYEDCVYMHLDKKLIDEQGYGRYERLDPGRLPPLYLAFKPDLGKVSGHVLNEIRQAYERGDRFVIETLEKIAANAEKGRDDYLRRDFSRWPRLMDENFDLRSRIMRISESNMEMIRTARRCGLPAKFAGSGGSILGLCADGQTYKRLCEELGKIGAQVIRPQII